MSMLKNVSVYDLTYFVASEIGKVCSTSGSIGSIIIILEMLILSKFEEKCKEDMKTFNY